MRRTWAINKFFSAVIESEQDSASAFTKAIAIVKLVHFYETPNTLIADNFIG